MTAHPADFLACYPRFYGRAYAGTRPDFTKCCEGVAGNAWGSKQCSRANGHGPHGAYCKQHDPVSLKAKKDARYAKWSAESENSARNREFAAACRKAIRDIAAGHNDPRGLAQSIIDNLEARA